MSKSVHPSKSIRDKYHNRPKNYKLQGVALVEVEAKVVRRGAYANLVFAFTHFDFPDQQFYAAKRYIHVTGEVEENSLFVLEEAVIPTVSVGSMVTLVVDENNRADGTEANDAPILLSAVHRIYVWKIWWIFAAYSS